eukprot:COSAG01_NODE_20_length_38868_cov_34.606071_8_plen_464_part_00
MSFAKVDKAAGKAPGYYNSTESSWGGFPIQDADGKWNLVHAQMAHHCPLGSWTSNSIVARSVSTTASPEGPYVFAEELLPPFAHNPSIRKAPDGTFVIFFIGGWKTNASSCKGGRSTHASGSKSSTQDNCTAGVSFDPPTSIRIGGDYRSVTLPAGASIADCAASCCADPRCEAFSFNNQSSGAPIVCKHKSGAGKLEQHTCPCCAAGSTVPGCSSGILGRTPAPQCNGRSWPKTCGSQMPGPQADCCGPDAQGLNAGCGISTATSKSLSGPWDVQPLQIMNQWESDDVYCAHTNPSVQLLPNGTAVMAFNAGFCHDHLETIGVAVSHGGLLGPWNLLAKNSILKNVDGSAHHCEDPHIWRSKRGWHLLTHNQQGPQGVSSYGYSLDAIHWTLSPTSPYDCTLHYTDGSTGSASGCGNRPQIFFKEGEDGATKDTPLFIINGATSGKPGGGKGTWTLFRPLAQ